MFEIPKTWMFQAYQEVKSKGGSAGIDLETIEAFERKLKDNLYRIWNRMSLDVIFHQQ